MGTGDPPRKIPPFGGTFLLSLGSNLELAILWRILTLTVRVLLLLAGLLPAALLTLLAGLPARVLILLAGILVLVGHRRSPLLKRNGETTEKPRVGFKGTCGSVAIIAWQQHGTTVVLEPAQTTPVQALQAAPRAVAGPGSRC